MNQRPVDHEEPDRLYTVTGGRNRADASAFDTVTLIVSECEPDSGMQSEHARVLAMCRRPMAVVEISAELALPVSVVKILLCDLLDTGRITVRHPSSATAPADRPAPETLEQVLSALESL
ncbi:hypothetical protein F4561_001274 [Lipingzhangella halophila]|uniref:DUF742 domain-containing protein n=1 Tax=Lipingzhangella halophila TaxID=1783352 RepID=A0A7W7RED7_9ACTN|nr:DUF742 domain-containing protein [Lipingzhangella halophila]MBB4930454.1 hypothetical protein [Lipingzhangella halophila]